MQLHSGLVGVGLLALAVDAHVASDHAFYCVILEKNLCCGEPREDLDPERLGLLAEPAAHVAQADDIVPVVFEAAGQHPARGSEGRFLSKEKKAVLTHCRSERRALFLPVRNELRQRARVHDRAGEDMGADLGAFLEHADRAFGGQLLEPDGGGQSRGPTAHDDDVVLHRFAGHARIIICRFYE
jgi:hypothetical protein